MIQIIAAALDFAGTYPFFTGVATIWALVALVPGISLFIRRLRDGGYSPWMSLFVLAGPVGAIVFLVLLCQPASVSVENARSVLASSGGPRGPDMSNAKATTKANSLILGLGILVTVAIVLGSVIFAVVQSSNLEAEAQESARLVASAESSRSAASASARAIAEADHQAAAAEANRLAIAARDEKQAEESRAAVASQAAADATAKAAEAIRSQLVTEGWSDGPDGVFYQWIPTDQVTCQTYQGCAQLKVLAADGCTNGVAVEVSQMTKGTVTGSSSAYSPGFLAGQNALVTLTTNDPNVDNFSIKKMTCR